MSGKSETILIHILDKEYRFSCAPDERDDLIASARYLDGKMREIRGSGRLLGADGVAVMAALNITNELLHDKTQSSGVDDELGSRIRLIQDKIEGALNRGRQMEL